MSQQKQEVKVLTIFSQYQTWLASIDLKTALKNIAESADLKAIFKTRTIDTRIRVLLQQENCTAHLRGGPAIRL